MSAISFYATFSRSEDQEYNFCSESCLDGFFRDRIEFQAIVRDFEK
jgi:YHS domain-containing protein